MENTRTTISKLTNYQLRRLMIELEKISKADAPALVYKTKLMNQLFAFEKEPYNYYLDQYHNIDSALRNEIVNRFKSNKI
jgi:hypothetical protein